MTAWLRFPSAVVLQTLPVGSRSRSAVVRSASPNLEIRGPHASGVEPAGGGEGGRIVITACARCSSNLTRAEHKLQVCGYTVPGYYDSTISRHRLQVTTCACRLHCTRPCRHEQTDPSSSSTVTGQRTIH